MKIEEVFDQIKSELPWVEGHRLVVGSLASRETVKDALLERAQIMPAWAVGTVGELASELSQSAGASPAKPLSLASRCDALERVARAGFMKEAAPELASHLRSRAVAVKVARFLTELDRFCADSGELSAVVDFLSERDRNLGAFVGVVSRLWDAGELSPWSDGFLLREAIAILERARLPRVVTLWGFAEFTPLEELFFGRLAAVGVKVRLLAPASLVESYLPGCQAAGFEAIALDEPSPSRVMPWAIHSVWDELEFLRDALAELRLKGVAWRDIAVFVPADDLYKRFARQKLHEWNVPLHDPTLSGAWKDRPRWTWWRDFFRVVGSGLKLEDVRAWLASSRSIDPESLTALFKSAFEKGVHGGARQWSSLRGEHDFPELALLVEAVPLFARAMTANEFLGALEAFVSLAERLLGPQAIESELLLAFGRHLRDERPFLEGFKARLPRFTSLFEEYLDARARTESVRATDGLQFVSHGVWLPRTPLHSFVLGANLTQRPKPGADAWSWEGLEVRRAWERLHFGLDWAERVRRNEALLLHGLRAELGLVVSMVDHDLAGHPQGAGPIYKALAGALKPEVKGGHSQVGWARALSRERSPQSLDAAVLGTVSRPDLFDLSKPISVSAFEDYLKCPFLYYARHLLKIESEDELGLDPNGRARGVLIHKVLGSFIEQEINGEPLGTRQDAGKRLEGLVDAEISSVLCAGRALPGLFRHKPLVDKARELIKTQALRWLDWEFERRKMFPGLKPFAVEALLEVELGDGLKVRGRADRVDSDGKHSVVIDYKTGKAPFIGKELLQGIGAQLVMYARGMQRSAGLEPAAAFYLSIGRKVEDRDGFFLKSHGGVLHRASSRSSGLFAEDFDALFAQVSVRWDQAASALRRGDFTPRPARPKKDCPSCRYESICGYGGQQGAEVGGE